MSSNVAIRRAHRIDSGLCKYTSSHGPATVGLLCRTCSEQNLASKRRAREAKAAARQAAKVSLARLVVEMAATIVIRPFRDEVDGRKRKAG